MAQIECIFPRTGESFQVRKSPSVLPPDNATLRLGEYGASHTTVAQLVVAPLFSEVTGNAKLFAHPAKIVDLGSGTGALAIAAAKKIWENEAEIASIVAIDKDGDAADDSASNLKNHIGQKRAEVDITVIQADWNDEQTWDAVKDADLILCNPPYIAADGNMAIRPGFENVQPEAMYMPSAKEVFDLYAMLAARSLSMLKPFGAMYFRLPKYDPAHNNTWPMDLARSPMVNAELLALENKGLVSSLISERYEPFLRLQERLGSDTMRHLHMLSIKTQPASYPFIDVQSDPAYAHYLNRGDPLKPDDYKKLLKLAGYPRTVGGGIVMAEMMWNHNYPSDDPRFIDHGL